MCLRILVTGADALETFPASLSISCAAVVRGDRHLVLRKPREGEAAGAVVPGVDAEADGARAGVIGVLRRVCHITFRIRDDCMRCQGESCVWDGKEGVHAVLQRGGVCSSGEGNQER